MLRLEEPMLRLRRRSSPRTGALAGFIDEGSAIEGRYSFSGTVMVNGRFDGEIATSDTLIVGEKGSLRGTVSAGTVIVNGTVRGDVRASERVELRGHARLFGDVEAPIIVVEEGVVFEGHCRMAPAAVVEDDDAVPARPLLADASETQTSLSPASA
jgi:cytoskeletal protein CcmA (bactofilin family)